MSAEVVAATVGMLQLIVTVVAVPMLKRELGALFVSLGELRARVGELKTELGVLDAMVSRSEAGVKLLVNEADNRRAEWAAAMRGE